MNILLRTAWIRLTANRKQFGVLCTLVGVGLLLWARLIVVSDMPKMAIADPEPVIEEPAPETTSDNQPRPVRSIRLESVPRVDPFVIDSVRFPRPTVSPENGGVRPKSDPQPVEDPQRVEAMLLRRLQASVDSLSLDAVMRSASLVVIDGRRYRLGHEVTAPAGGQRFIVAEVRQRSVVLEAEGRRFELKMSIPSG